MREPQEKTIEGKRYRVAPLGAADGLRVMAKLAHAIGPALEDATSLADLGERLFPALGRLAKQLDGEDLVYVCGVLARSSRVEPAPGTNAFIALSDVFDTHFQGDFAALFGWAAFALEVNFGFFFAK